MVILINDQTAFFFRITVQPAVRPDGPYIVVKKLLAGLFAVFSDKVGYLVAATISGNFINCPGVDNVNAGDRGRQKGILLVNLLMRSVKTIPAGRVIKTEVPAPQGRGETQGQILRLLGQGILDFFA